VNQNIIEDFGENYQYAKVIFDNRLKIIKLKSINFLYSKIGKIVLIAGTLFFALLFIIGLLIGLSLWIGSKIESSSMGFILGFGTLIPLNILIYLFRKPLIYRPLANQFLKAFINKENNND
jgi:hypothetical protein